MKPQHLVSSIALVLLVLPVNADFITGQVVDEFGVGVPGVNIDVKNIRGGGTPPIFNDGTNAGGFFMTTVPAGFYRITFTPPTPPASSHLIVDVDDVIVTGTTNMGVISLPPGVLVSGRILNPSGIPVIGVNLDVIVISTGDSLPLAGDTSNAFGEFVVATPNEAIELRLKTAGVPGQTLAPRRMSLQLAGAKNLGNIGLEQGFILSGTVLGPGVVPVASADFDLAWSRTGAGLYTPGDNTDIFGNFSIIVPAGIFDVELCPLQSNRLVAHSVDGIVINANRSLGTIQLNPGVLLTGTVRDFGGAIVAGADIDVKDANGAQIELCGDNSSAAGSYAVIVPTGVLDIEIEPPGFALPLGVQDINGLNIVADTLLDGSLPPCPFSTPKGIGSKGKGGITPSLTATGGAPRAGNSAYGFSLTDTVGGGFAFLSNTLTGLFGPRGVAMPGFGAPLDNSTSIISHGSTLLSGTPGVAGDGAAFFGVPVDPSLIGISTLTRAWVVDPSSPGSMAASNGLLVSFCE